jgi:putative transposase
LLQRADGKLLEMIHHQHYEAHAHAKAAIREFIEIFYNRQRRHSCLGYQSPAVFAEAFKHMQAASDANVHH